MAVSGEQHCHDSTQYSGSHRVSGTARAWTTGTLMALPTHSRDTVSSFKFDQRQESTGWRMHCSCLSSAFCSVRNGSPTASAGASQAQVTGRMQPGSQAESWQTEKKRTRACRRAMSVKNGSLDWSEGSSPGPSQSFYHPEGSAGLNYKAATTQESCEPGKGVPWPAELIRNGSTGW